MESLEYRRLLNRLPIESPTPQDMATLCPHLTTEEAVRAFTTNSGYVACPPLRIRHGFQIISYDKGSVNEVGVQRIVDGQEVQVVTSTKERPPRLSWSYARRTPESYADGRSHGDVFWPYEHMKKAMRFAEDNWGNELILDDWDSVGEFYVEDPTDLCNNGSPRTKAILRVALSRDFNEIGGDSSKPASELFDEAISQMTLDPVIWHELKGGRGSFINFNCAHCGAGLLLSSCTGCEHRFRDDHLRSGWYTPLSRKMVTFLRENGHEFKVDPEIAWAKERQKWERTDARGDTR